MKIQIVTVTPELASMILESNRLNRSIKKNHVRYLANQMTNGEWELSPQGIALEGSIKEPERVLDGQHRLLAIVESGKCFEMVIAEFCDPKVYGILDTGIVRNMRDLTGIERKVIDVVSYLIQVSAGHNMRSTAAKVLDSVKIMQPVIDAMGETFTLSTKIVMQAPIRAAFACRVLEDQSRATEINTIMRHVSSFDTNGIPKVWASWLKRMHTGNLTSSSCPKRHFGSRSILFALTWDALNPTKAENSRIQILSELEHIEAARKVLRAAGI
jgi:hypothetical protein